MAYFDTFLIYTNPCFNYSTNLETNAKYLSILTYTNAMYVRIICDPYLYNMLDSIRIPLTHVISPIYLYLRQRDSNTNYLNAINLIYSDRFRLKIRYIVNVINVVMLYT